MFHHISSLTTSLTVWSCHIILKTFIYFSSQGQCWPTKYFAKIEQVYTVCVSCSLFYQRVSGRLLQSFDLAKEFGCASFMYLVLLIHSILGLKAITRKMWLERPCIIGTVSSILCRKKALCLAVNGTSLDTSEIIEILYRSLIHKANLFTYFDGRQHWAILLTSY